MVTFRKVFCMILSVFILVQNTPLFIDAGASSPTTIATPSVSNGLYLRYEEEVNIVWEDWGWTDKKVGDVVRSISVVEVEDENFTVLEKIDYVMHLPSDLNYAYVDLRFMDEHVETLAEGNSTDLGLTYDASVYMHYVVNKTDGEVLKVWKDDETDSSSEIPLQLEHYWGYHNISIPFVDPWTNRWEYAWDAVGFPVVGDIWGYSVTPNLVEDDVFDEWTVESVDKVSFLFDGVQQSCMNLSNAMQDSVGEEVLAEWNRVRWCDTDTGIKVKQRWIGDCQVQVYDVNSHIWSLLSGFSLFAEQILANTNFRLMTSDKVRIVSPKQGQLVEGKTKIQFEFNPVPILYQVGEEQIANFVVKAKSFDSEAWTDVWEGTSDDAESACLPDEVCQTKMVSFDWDTPVDAEGKWQINVTCTDYRAYYDVIDVYFKPIQIREITTASLNQELYGPYEYGPYDTGALVRVPVEVSFSIYVNQEPSDGKVKILIDCWYLPLYWAKYSNSINGTAAEVTLFREKYGREVSNDPIHGKKEGGLWKWSGGYVASGYKWTRQRGENVGTGTVMNNTYGEISVEDGDEITFTNKLFFVNPDFPEFRLYSFDVIIIYNATVDDEVITMTEQRQETIGIKHVEPITPSSAVQAITLGGLAEAFFGREFGQKVYKATKSSGFEVGAKLLLTYSAAVAIDTVIMVTVAGFFLYGTMTAPLLIGGVNAYLTLANRDSIPTSFADVLMGAIQSTYGSLDPDERVDLWFSLITSMIGEAEAELVDSRAILSWAGITYPNGTGGLAQVTLERRIRTYESAGKYYLQLNISSPSKNSYNARFFGIVIVTATGHKWYIPSEVKSYWTWVDDFIFGRVGSYVPAGTGKYLLIQPGENWNYQIEENKDWWIGSTAEGSTWEVRVYFGPDLWRGSSPIYTWQGDASIANVPIDWGTEEFDIPAVSHSISALSPLDIHVYDQYGRHVGVNSTGGVDVEIPGVWYSGPDTFPEYVFLSDPELEYRYEMIGTGDGECDIWFHTPIEVTDNTGYTYEVLMKLGLSNVTISDGEAQLYKYDFNYIDNRVSQLVSQGWSLDDAAYSVMIDLDTDGDGTPDVLDKYPTELFDLMQEVRLEADTYHVRTLTNSTVMSFQFNVTLMQIRFYAAGITNVQGFCNLTIPKTLLRGAPWTITVDGASTDFVMTENTMNTSLYFTYTHGSTSHVVVQGTWVVPEYPSTLIILLAIMSSLFAAVLVKRKSERRIDWRAFKFEREN